MRHSGSSKAFQHISLSGHKLLPTAEEDLGEDEEGDVEVTQVEHTEMGDAVQNPSDMGVDGGSLSAVNPIIDGSSMGFGETPIIGGSQMQSTGGNPRIDPGPSGALQQAYDLVDSMGQVADHTVVPSDHLDTGAMISVPQVQFPMLWRNICL